MRRYQSRWSGLTGFITPESAGFDGKRDQDPPVKGRGPVAILGADRVVPQAVEIHPFGPDHLRPRIFRVRFRGIDLRRPARGERSPGWLPFRGIVAGCHSAQGRGEDHDQTGGMHGEDIR